jgi:hypothetical protein
MEMISNSVSTVTQLWKSSNLRAHKDGDDTFYETSVRTSATLYKVPVGIFNILASYKHMNTIILGNWLVANIIGVICVMSLFYDLEYTQFYYRGK